MGDRPILFSAPMVRAILAGRKTMTRRVVKPQPYIANIAEDGMRFWNVSGVVGGRIMLDPDFLASCPYGHPGDRLWVRETWAELIAVSPASDQPIAIGPGERLIEPPTSWTDGGGRIRWHYDGKVIAYRANSDIEFCDGDGFTGDFADRSDMPRWRPSIHMPRWASRILLEITGMRVERVQSISQMDALAEGIDTEGADYIEGENLNSAGSPISPERFAFATLWDSINAKRGFGWAANPWVWVIEFKRVD